MEDIKKFCQSCSMPLTKTEDYGTNADGSQNEDYCVHCFKEGEFASDLTMEQMIDYCVPYMAQANEGMSEEQAKAKLKEFFPHLKRWKK